MADFNFTVDTRPMASEIKSVSKSVNMVSGAVVAMQAAVIEAEKESADHICENVNRGFYSLMHSQISQKIAQLTSTVEVKLMSLMQYANALKNIKGRMQNDYNMISARYGKLFKAINSNLEYRVAELDSAVFRLVDKDIKIADTRTRLNSAQFAVNQVESILTSQLVSNARIKNDADQTLSVVSDYVKCAAEQSVKTQNSMYDVTVDSVEDIYIPVSVIESTSSECQNTVSFYVAKSGNAEIDRNIEIAVQEQSENSVHADIWADTDSRKKAKVEEEFLKLLADSEEDERVRGQIEKMFMQTIDVK